MFLNKVLFNVLYKEPYGKSNFSCDQSKYKRFNSVDKATAWAEKYYSEWSRKYEDIYGVGFHNNLDGCMIHSSSEDPIRFYCGYCGEKLNGYLRGASIPLIDQTSFNDALATLLLFSPRIPENIVLYRYVPDLVIELILQKNKKDCTYVDKGFMSCSLLYDPPNHDYFNYENVLEIYVDAQTVGVYTNLIEGCRRSEFEILILRNAHLYLIDYPYKKGNRMVYPMRLRNITDCISPFL